MKHFYTRLKIYHLMIITASVFISACGGDRSDEEIQKDVTEKLSGEENNNAYANVTATVNEGVITLNGECIGNNCADSVVTKVKEVEGVKDVVNNIKQKEEETDLTLRTSVQSIISKYQGVQADVAGGVVVLRGVIQRDQVQPLMNELENLSAKKIDNQLAIK